MPVKDLNVGDIVLVELLKHGRSAAPQSITGPLHAAGLVKIEGGKRVLTAKGRDRAERLRSAEDHLRQLFGAGGGFDTAGGPSLKAVGSRALRG